jgi:hypothetical protein
MNYFDQIKINKLSIFFFSTNKIIILHQVKEKDYLHSSGTSHWVHKTLITGESYLFPVHCWLLSTMDGNEEDFTSQVSSKTNNFFFNYFIDNVNLYASRIRFFPFNWFLIWIGYWSLWWLWLWLWGEWHFLWWWG